MPNEEIQTLAEVADGDVWFVRQRHVEAASFVLRDRHRLSQEVSRLSNKLVNSEEEVKRVRQSFMDNGSKIDELCLKAEKLTSETKKLYDSNTQLEKERDYLHATIEKQAIYQDQLREQMKGVLKELKKVKQSRDEEYANHSSTINERNNFDNGLAQLEEDVRLANDKSTRLTDEANRQREERVNLENELKEVSKQAVILQARLQEKEKELNKAKENAVIASSKFSELNFKLQKIIFKEEE